MKRSAETTRSAASGRHSSPWRAAGVLLVVLLALAGSGMIAVSLLAAPVSPPQPAPAAAPTWPSESGPATNPSHPGSASMARSAPIEVSIPRIGVTAKIMKLGLNPNGTLATPPLDQAERAGWYHGGPSPGEIGNAVVVGHVDSSSGPAVFFNLGALMPGDFIDIKREDATLARFVVNGVASYPKSSFPTDLVYGPSASAALRLITCGGAFDTRASSYLSNVVVFAALVPPPRG
jgi:hypothetical protein